MSAPPSVIAKSSPYSAGETIAGKYKLVRVLGEGGMGTVWEARNTALEIDVAVKLIHADLNKETFGMRLRQEARAAAKLGHPAIVRVFDVGETALGDPFIVMELLHGQTLGGLIDLVGPVQPQRAVQLLLPIADALVVAHSKGIVHRDLKPDNVFIVTDSTGEQPKLLDFGIVKLEHDEADTSLTQVGSVVGSPDYMSPEQARGAEDIDHRVDIWSFSVMLYEAVTGQVPFEAANYNALLRTIVECEPTSTVALGVPDSELWQIIKLGLAKAREQRWQSMTEYGRALAGWLKDRGVHEDACGASLETKWLSRTSDALSKSGTGPRVSLASFSEIAPQRASATAGPSSHRAVVRSLSRAATVEQFPLKRRLRYVVGGAGALVALGIAAAYFLTRADSEPPAVASVPTASMALAAPRPPAPSASVVKEAVVAPGVTAEPSSSIAPAAKAPPAKPPRRPAPVKKQGTAPKKTQADAELISPY